jgi:hypothetical protein
MVLWHRHIQWALAYFFIIALLGVSLRLFSVMDVPITYRYVVHAHSHIALLGWVYTALTTLLYFLFLRNKSITRIYKIFFWATQATILGMLLIFPFTGYALLSITFSTLFLFASYFFTHLFLKHSTKTERKLPSHLLLRTALWYMVLSSLGPWALGGIMATAGTDSPWYRNAIYFYLHFQYNGWFLVALCGLFFRMMENFGIRLSATSFKRFYVLLQVGVVLTFFISILWMKPHPIVYLLAGMGALLQIAAFSIVLGKVLYERYHLAIKLPATTKLFLKFAGITLGVKLIAQVMVVFPAPAEVISGTIDFVISYLHWVFLGFVTTGLFAFLYHYGLVSVTKRMFWMYIMTFMATEVLIFYRGASAAFNLPSLPFYAELLTVASMLLALVIGWVFVRNLVQTP